MSLVEGGVGGGGSDAAGAVLLVDVLGDADVAILSPAGSPTVLDLPEVVSVSAVSNSEDPVVEVGARDVGHDATRVKLPVEVGIDSDRDGLLGDSSGEGILGVGNISVGDASGAGNGSAGGLASGVGSAGGSVRVVILGAEAISGNVLEGVVHEATVAAHVSVLSVTGDKLLLREGDSVAVLLVVGSLHATGGGEGPARSAGSLVLDVSDVPGSNPVNRVRSLDTLEGVHEARALLAGDRLVEVEGRELLEGEVGELVVAEGVRGVARVVGLNEVRVGSEDGETLGELLAVLELKAVLGDVVDKVYKEGKEQGLVKEEDII